MKKPIIIKEDYIMNKAERSEKIDEFLKAWDAMLFAAKQIDDFTFNFEVGITSYDSIMSDRVRTINGINEAFTKNGMSWSSSSK